MEGSELTLVPQWLKNNGNITRCANSYPSPSSKLDSDDRTVSKASGSKSSARSSDHGIEHSTPSCYPSSSSGSNGGSHSQTYSSFSRKHLDRHRDREIYEPTYKDKPISRKQRPSDPSGFMLPNGFENDGCMHSISSGKWGGMQPRKAEGYSANITNQSNGNDILGRGSVVRSTQKVAFERDFPSLGAEKRQTAASEIGRVPPSGFNTSIGLESLPVGSSAMVDGGGWTSALAEVPAIIENNGNTNALLTQRTVYTSTATIAASIAGGLSMAETLAHGSHSTSHNTPQAPVGTERRDGLAFKQSRRLIPITPSVHKTSVLNPLEKPKPKNGQQQQTSSLIVSDRVHSVLAKSDVRKASTFGKLHILKPAQERNTVLSSAKDSLSPTNDGEVLSNPQAVASSTACSNPLLATMERKPSTIPTMEIKTKLQAQSRNDFFNLMRKKSNTKLQRSTTLDPGPVASLSVIENSDGLCMTVAAALDTDSRGDKTSNGDTFHVSSRYYLMNGEKYSGPYASCYPEDEEAAFLRSLGWEGGEDTGEDEGLTEEEISAFFKEHMKLRPSCKLSEKVK